MKTFNTTGVCNPKLHYMVDLTERIAKIKEMVLSGKYFTINRARQYGKTTTLSALRLSLQDCCSVISIDFQGIGHAGFQSEEDFVQEFCRLLRRKRAASEMPDSIYISISDLLSRKEHRAKFGELFDILTDWSEHSAKPLVLIIDEVDSAANNQVFLDFLSQLRDGYIARETDGTAAFLSVILAGVTDIRYLRSKIREDEQHKVNSPWNIAADFDLDMSLSEEGIRGMLAQYEEDHHTGMDIARISRKIRNYTGGYPYLVSRICELVDCKLVPEKFQDLPHAWTSYGVEEAIRILLSEDNSLFDSLIGKLTNYPVLKIQIRNILMRGETIAYLPDNEEQRQLRMYGFLTNNHGTIAISNRIFEMRLYVYFIGENSQTSLSSGVMAESNLLKQSAAENKSIFVEDGWLNIPKIMGHFIEAHHRIHGDSTERFLEEEGRERFLTYLSPIINGTGTYDIEPQTRNQKRMDVVVHYLGRVYVIELKIWRGDRYNEKGEQQILEYLDYFKLDTGYMLSFSFNREKTTGVKRIEIGNKTLFEGVV